VVLLKIECIVTDLMSKVRSFAHPTCNGNARIEVRPLADLVLLVLHTKFDVFGYCNKLGNHLDCIPCLAFLCIFETGMYCLYNISRFVVLRSEQRACGRILGALQQKGLPF